MADTLKDNKIAVLAAIEGIEQVRLTERRKAVEAPEEQRRRVRGAA